MLWINRLRTRYGTSGKTPAPRAQPGTRSAGPISIGQISAGQIVLAPVGPWVHNLSRL
jgi:hypothetical protein